MLRLRKPEVEVAIGLRMLVSAAGTLQVLFDRPAITHAFCNRQALIILRRDGLMRCADFLAGYGKELDAGVIWADRGWKNVGHYYEPLTQRGLWRFPNAVWDFRQYFGRALQYCRWGDWARGVFFLGAAAHLVQDLCVPHHARTCIGDGHQKYEAWVQEHRRQYRVDFGGCYGACHPAQSLLLYNAEVAADFLNRVDKHATPQAYHEATALLLPQAQRTTAGLFHQFWLAAQSGARAA